MKRLFGLTLTLLLIVSLFAGCGASQSAPAEVPMEEEMGAVPNDQLAAGDTGSRAPLPENRKWVITSYVQAETEDLDALMEGIQEKLRELEGYMEAQDVYHGSEYASYRHRSAQLTVRVPADRLDAFLDSLQKRSNVVSSSRNLQDITLQYTDTETRLKALRTEETRLLELLAQAETMSDLLEIEARLTEVRYEIENVTSRLRTYDNQVDYATVHLSLEEVREYTPVEEPGVWQRIRTGFMDSLEGVADGAVDFAVWLIVSIPYLVIWAAVITAAVLVIRRVRKNRKLKKKKVPEQEEKK